MASHARRVPRRRSGPALAVATLVLLAGCGDDTTPVEAVPEPSGRGLVLDYWGRPAAVEIVDGPWAGRELRLGPARVRVLGGIDRCAVIDLDPATGASGTRLLQTLAGYRLHGRAIDFGMYAEVTVPGPVSRDDRVTVVSN